MTLCKAGGVVQRRSVGKSFRGSRDQGPAGPTGAERTSVSEMQTENADDGKTAQFRLPQPHLCQPLAVLAFLVHASYSTASCASTDASVAVQLTSEATADSVTM